MFRRWSVRNPASIPSSSRQCKGKQDSCLHASTAKLQNSKYVSWMSQRICALSHRSRTLLSSGLTALDGNNGRLPAFLVDELAFKGPYSQTAVWKDWEALRSKLADEKQIGRTSPTVHQACCTTLSWVLHRRLVQMADTIERFRGGSAGRTTTDGSPERLRGKSQSQRSVENYPATNQKITNVKHSTSLRRRCKQTRVLLAGFSSSLNFFP